MTSQLASSRAAALRDSLNWAREIVEALGGRITLESEAGRGTRIVVSLKVEEILP